MTKKYTSKHYYYLLFIIFLLFFNKKSIAQCAGTDNTIIICDKEDDELNPTIQTYNLFDQLGGNPIKGGVWSVNHPFNSTALVNAETGILNLWAITRNGTHSFTYTNDTCNESATITIHLGGYAGEDNLIANACSDDSSADLNVFLSDELNDELNADTNGTWSGDIDATPHLSNDGFFNAEDAGVGTYTFTYTVNQVETCPSKTAEVILKVREASNAGTGSNLILCESDDLSRYTDFDLFNLLTDNPDRDGIWFDDNNTDQIDDFFDHTINIQEIFNNNPSSDSFQYTYHVIKDHIACKDKFATVIISKASLSGSFNVNNYCNDDTLNINLSYNNNDLVEFSHNLIYEIRNTNTNELVYTSNNIAIDAELIKASGDILEDYIQYNYNANSFLLSPSPITKPGGYTISVVSITDIDGIICESLEILADDFIVYQPLASITDEDACVKKDEIINIPITNHIGADGNTVNATEALEYNISDGNNTFVINNDITFVDGEATIPVDLNSFTFPENDLTASITLSFNNIEGTSLECLNSSISLNFPPNKIQLSIDVDNECDATTVEAKVEAQTLPDGEYNITYEVTEIGNTEILLSGNRVITGGTITDDLNISTLEKGNYQVTLKSVQNDTTPCRTEFEFELIETFSIAGIPDAPTLEANQSFCFKDYAPNGPTIADIAITTGENLIWYKTDDISDTTILDVNEILENGNYYVSSSDPNNDCDDSERVIVTISIETPSIPTTDNQTQTFCASNNPTLEDINILSENNGTIIWYANNGDELLIDTPLQNNTNYFATELLVNCESEPLEFSVNLITPPTPIYEGETELCPLLTPTILNLEEKEVDNEIIKLIQFTDTYELIWYDSEEDGNELSSSEILEENINYYAVLREKETGCEGERLAISITFTTCDPEEYNFFIPDGFSPNNDGVNDTYFIPNIEYFYPDYYFEIFNRYGQSLFKGDLSNPVWDGTYNGAATETTSGVYFYIINYNQDNLKPSQGRLYLSK